MMIEQQYLERRQYYISQQVDIIALTFYRYLHQIINVKKCWCFKLIYNIKKNFLKQFRHASSENVRKLLKNTNVLDSVQDIFQQFIMCDNRTQSPILFQNIFRFLTKFLPKFSNILPFFCSFSEKSHTCPYFLEQALAIMQKSSKNIITKCSTWLKFKCPPPQLAVAFSKADNFNLYLLIYIIQK